jgi:hypothetical protein
MRVRYQYRPVRLITHPTKSDPKQIIIEFGSRWAPATDEVFRWAVEKYSGTL